MTNPLPADHLARQQALDPSQSFAVTAPAGSGKTGLLTQRVLALLARCDEPEEVLSITFTRKAAAEMQERISQAIHQAATQPRPEAAHAQVSWDLAQAVLQQDKVRRWQLLQNPSRLRIQTIDGLCRALTRQNPLASQIGGQSQLLDQPQQAYQQAVSATLATLEEDGDLSQDLAVLLTHLDNNLNAIASLLVSLLARRDQWMGHLYQIKNAKPYLESVLGAIVTEALTETQQRLKPWSSELLLLADYAGQQCLTLQPESSLVELAGITELPAIHADALKTWRLLVDLLLTQSGSWRSPKGLTIKCGFPPGTDKDSKAAAKQRKSQMADLLSVLAEQPKLLSQLQLIRYLPPSHYAKDQWKLIDSLTHILPRLVAELKLVFRQLNATDFIEITQGALTVFGAEDEPSNLALALDYKIQHILVDEFQDTSGPQLQLLECLTRGWQADDGRTLFIVGDGMQSCYGFRDANVGIFLNARRQGIGNVALLPLELTVNFRSQAGIINWINNTFSAAFPDADDIAKGAVCYSPALAYNAERPEPAVETLLFANQNDRLAEAEKVSQLVTETLDRDPSGKIAILVRNRGHLRQILPALQSANIRWLAADIDPLISRMAIQDLLSLTKALLNPADRLSWAAILKAPWCGLDLNDLYIMAGPEFHTTTDKTTKEPGAEFIPIHIRLEQLQSLDLSPGGTQILRRFAQVILTSTRERRRKSLRSWIEGTWLALGGPATLHDTSDLQNCQTFFKLLERYDQGGQITAWPDFTNAVNALYAAPAQDANPQIQVMTIHKSKGLEFDTVIIPGLDKVGRADGAELLLWQERIGADGEKQLMMSTLAATGEETDPIYNYLKEEQKLRTSLELTRLFYVGCTRAINKLYLLSNVNINEKSEIKAPPKGSLLSHIWDTLAPTESPVIHPTTLPQSLDSPAPIMGYGLRLKPDWKRPTLIPSTLLAAYRGKEFGDDDNLPTPETLAQRQAKHTGTVIHAALQQITEEGFSQWDNDRITKALPWWRLQLQQLGVFHQGLQQALTQVELAVRKTLDDPSGQWILDNRHGASACELELQYGKRQIQTAILDRTFIDQGTRWIIDYKSSTPSDQQTLAHFIQQEIDAYRPQLIAYQQAISLLNEDIPIKLALYFPLLQHFAEVS